LYHIGRLAVKKNIRMTHPTSASFDAGKRFFVCSTANSRAGWARGLMLCVRLFFLDSRAADVVQI